MLYIFLNNMLLNKPNIFLLNPIAQKIKIKYIKENIESGLIKIELIKEISEEEWEMN